MQANPLSRLDLTTAHLNNFVVECASVASTFRAVFEVARMGKEIYQLTENEKHNLCTMTSAVKNRTYSHYIQRSATLTSIT